MDHGILKQTDVDVRLSRSSEGVFVLTVHDRRSRGRLVEFEMDAELFADLMSNRGIFEVPARVATPDVSAVVGKKRLTTALRLPSNFHPSLDGEAALRELDNWATNLWVHSHYAFGTGATISVQSVRGGYDVLVRHFTTEDIDGLPQELWLSRAFPAEWKQGRS